MSRIAAIDAFRGLSIAAMVFFGILAGLSNNLPWLLQHNVSNEFRPGDLVLPMFLFVSGLSLPYFLERRKSDPQKLLLDSIGRMGKLLGVGFLFSGFSTGQLLGMDEMVLNAVLFPAAWLMARYGSIITWSILFVAILAGYSIVHASIGTTIFEKAVLGGYPAAMFYFPVMLAGVIAGKGMVGQGVGGGLDTHKWLKTAAAAIAGALLLGLVFPIDKLHVTPSFMMLGIGVSIAILLGMDVAGRRGLRLPTIEYMGQNPLRYWVFLFLFFIIPHFMCYLVGKCPAELNLPWPEALAASIAYMGFFILVSRAMDGQQERIERIKRRLGLMA